MWPPLPGSAPSSRPRPDRRHLFNRIFEQAQTQLRLGSGSYHARAIRIRMRHAREARLNGEERLFGCGQLAPMVASERPDTRLAGQSVLRLRRFLNASFIAISPARLPCKAKPIWLSDPGEISRSFATSFICAIEPKFGLMWSSRAFAQWPLQSRAGR